MLITLEPEMHAKMDGSSGWSAKGRRSRGSSTISTSSGVQFDELENIIQSLAVGVQKSNTLGEVMRSEQAATASAITIMGTDVKRLVTKVDLIEEQWVATKKIFEKTNSRVEKVEEAIQEHAKKIQQMEEDIAKMNAGGTLERIARGRKTMENDTGEKDKGQWSPSFITLNGWDVDRKMETMMDSADARKLSDNSTESLPAHRRAVIDEEITYSDLIEKVHHLKIMIRIKA